MTQLSEQETPWCCEPGCGKDAEFVIDTINGGPDIYSDQTHACARHVGILLGHQPDAPHPDRVWWEVRPIEAADSLYARHESGPRSEARP